MEQIIIVFSKANKVGQAKAKAFADAVIADYLQSHPVKVGGGRPVSETTMALRNNVLGAMKTLQDAGDKITTAALAEKIGGSINMVYLNNALVWHEQAGNVVRVGKDTSKVGKGKKPILWSLKAE